MMTSIKRPSGGNAGWFDKVWRRLKELRVIPGRGLVSTQTPEGMILSVKETAKSAAGGGTQSFKGEWSHTANYTEGDIVYLPQGYNYGNPAVALEPYNLQSFIYCGTWIALTGTSGDTPGTDDEKWQRFSFGPQSATYIVDATNGFDSFLQMDGGSAIGSRYAIAGENNPATGAPSVVIGKTADGDWYFDFYSAAGGRLLLSASHFTGTMQARTVYVAEDGALKSMVILGTEPEVVSA